MRLRLLVNKHLTLSTDEAAENGIGRIRASVLAQLQTGCQATQSLVNMTRIRCKINRTKTPLWSFCLNHSTWLNYFNKTWQSYWIRKPRWCTNPQNKIPPTFNRCWHTHTHTIPLITRHSCVLIEQLLYLSRHVAMGGQERTGQSVLEADEPLIHQQPLLSVDSRAVTIARVFISI